MTSRTLRNIVLIWLAWSIILIGYMQLVQLRYAPDRPDYALSWTGQETTRNSQNGKIYLNDPFFNTQVSWDSEFYLSIATFGYDDPAVRVLEGNEGEAYSMNYAFFPFYPMLMKVVRLPFTLFGLTPIAASTLAGVIVSLVGTLAGIIALYDIVREELGEDGGIRTLFYMLIFPTSMFFAVIYTEGLFVGLAFGSLALMRRKQWVWAAVLAALATWTRSIGGALVVPLLISWALAYRDSTDRRGLWIRLPLMFLPVIAYGLWRLQYGTAFDFVEDIWFGNKLLDIDTTLQAWGEFLERAQEFPETAVTSAMQVITIALALLSCLLTFRRYPQIAVFGLIAIVIPFTAGYTSINSTIRYMIVVPTLWIMLGRWGRNPVFDRAWTLVSILLLAMQAFLFSYDFWVA